MSMSAANLERYQKNARKAAASAAHAFDKHASDELIDDLRVSMVAKIDAYEVVIHDDKDDDNDTPAHATFVPNPLYHWSRLDQISLSNNEDLDENEETEYARDRFADRSLEEGNFMSVKRLNMQSIPTSSEAAAVAAAFCLECKFLSNLPRHPNIAQIFAVHASGPKAPFFHQHQKDDDEESDPLPPDAIPNVYFHIVDALSETLLDRFDKWRHKHSYADDQVFQQHEGVEERANKISQRLDVILDVLSAMAFLQKNKVVYVLHPSKVGFDAKYQRIKLFDFGQARESGKPPFYDTLTTSLTNASVTAGEEGMYRRVYVAPELLRYVAGEDVSSSEITCSVDVFAGGMLLWETLTLSRPFAGWSQEMHYNQVVLGKTRPYLNSTWPASIRRLLQDCWHPNRSNRPDMSKVVQRLETALFNFQEEFKGIDRTEEHERNNKYSTVPASSSTGAALGGSGGTTRESSSKSRKIKYQRGTPAVAEGDEDKSVRSKESMKSRKSRDSVRSRSSKDSSGSRTKEPVRSSKPKPPPPSRSSSSTSPGRSHDRVKVMRSEKNLSRSSDSKDHSDEQRSSTRLSRSSHSSHGSSHHRRPSSSKLAHRSASPSSMRRSDRDLRPKSPGTQSSRVKERSSSSRVSRSVSDDRLKPSSSRSNTPKEERKPPSRRGSRSSEKRASEPNPAAVAELLASVDAEKAGADGYNSGREEIPRRAGRRKPSTDMTTDDDNAERGVSPSSLGNRSTSSMRLKSGSSQKKERGTSPADAEGHGVASRTPHPRGVRRAKSLGSDVVNASSKSSRLSSSSKSGGTEGKSRRQPPESSKSVLLELAGEAPQSSDHRKSSENLNGSAAESYLRAQMRRQLDKSRSSMHESKSRVTSTRDSSPDGEDVD